MNDLSHKSNDGFNLPENEEWFVVHSGAVTNTNPGSRLSTLIHEVTHFADTFSSGDSRYGLDPVAAEWARNNPDQALSNADTLTGYVIYGEPLFAV